MIIQGLIATSSLSKVGKKFMTDLSKVPVFILAGGLGTRISEETALKPKPMIEIGEAPILLHIMRWYHSFGFNDFVICGGYKAWEIKEFFLNYQFRQNDLCIDHRAKEGEPARCDGDGLGHEKWRVRVMDTGVETLTGGRLAMALDRARLGGDFENFAVTYGDGVTDVNLAEEFKFHQAHGKIGTMLAVAPLSRFGEIELDNSGVVQHFIEKPEDKLGLINGGFFFFKKEFRKFVEPVKNMALERVPLEHLARERQLVAYSHRGFWQCMDTLRDKNYLQEIWESGEAPWRPR
jgi:glucose-1-phosphate cytidylyltransferase